ncbi:hypothetical protein JY651_26635 [Pyxidicoccus parkwayensis]|uniref:Lipoprotein n=1 Tax=Pyxidicoccus parkwayensis TaxID=2813578 RepID=A0ABX7NJ84_9BACT|nr:hypothetical protein [Pyxidicoccus parkwaysis]QSQ18932.1 hypothetical protein JY651_26635 [Pyxidicoccus parkwaysis]
MNRTALTVLSGLLALTATVACSSSQAKPTSSAASSDTAKLSAPVTVDAKLDGEKAHVTLRFDAPASDVQVNVSGLDGLAVKSEASPVKGGSFARADEKSFDVDITPGPGRSLLVVAISGTFQGAPLSKVVTFSTGKPTAEQQKTSGTTVTGSDGERIKIMPSGGQ